MNRLNRTDISQIYHEGEEAVIALVESLQNALALLEARVAVLEGQIKKTSKTSSKPPSSDGLRRTLSSREPSGKKPGGQDKHEGQTLERRAVPDAVIVHRAPLECASCQSSLETTAAEITETRQVFDVPKVQVQVTEHRVEQKICPCCQARAKASFPVGVNAPVQYGSRVSSLAVYLNVYHLVPRERTVEILEELCGVHLSNGSIENILARAYQLTESTENAIEAALIASDGIHADETGARVNGKTHWIHVAANDRLTHYHPSLYRGKEAHAETGILERFAASGGVLHTDFYVSYRSYDCLHAYCNAHLLRELRFLAEVRKHDWAQEIREILRQSLHTLKEHRQGSNNHQAVLSKEQLHELHHRYDTLVEAALRLHPRTTEREHGITKGRIKQTEERRLLERLRDYKADILRFAENPCANFDNNLAERDIRMIKVQQKISGCFRSMNGAEVFCRLRGFCSTVRKHSAAILDALFDIFHGKDFQLNFEDT